MSGDERELRLALFNDPDNEDILLAMADFLDRTGRPAQARAMRIQMGRIEQTNYTALADHMPAFSRELAREVGFEPSVINYKSWYYRNGLPACLRFATFSQLRGCAESVFSRWPIEFIIIDSMHAQSLLGGQFVWHSWMQVHDRQTFLPNESIIPQEVDSENWIGWSFDNETEANHFLSDIMIAYGKKVAGVLPCHSLQD